MPKPSLRTLFVLLATLLPGFAQAADVTGILTGDTVWYATNSPYRMIGDVTIPPGLTLTIEPGVTVTTTSSDNQLSGDTTKVELFVEGTLKVGVDAAGNADPTRPVILRGTGSTGGWGGIIFQEASSGHVFKNAEVAYATYGIQTLATAGLTLDDTIVHHTTLHGLWVKDSTASLTLRGSAPATSGAAKAAVYNCGSAGSSYRGIYNQGALTLTSVEIHSNYYTGVYSTGNSQITGCNIRGNGNSGGSYPYGVYLNNALASGSQTLSRNTIWDNYYGGVYAYLSTSGLTFLIEHNTIDRNDDYSSTTYGIRATGSSTSTFTVRDNIITNNKTYGLYGNAYVTAHNNLVWNHSTDYSTVTPGAGAVSCNPLYVAENGSNYRITSNSPARMADSLDPQRDLGALSYLSDPTVGLQGILRQNTTLTAAASPHLMPGDLIVPAGITLTVEPGAVVQPASSDNMKCMWDTGRTELIVEGALSAAGTSTSPIAFKPSSTSAGAWYGLRFEDGSTPGTLSYVEVAYGVDCIHTDASSLVLSNSKVHHCSEDGVVVGLTTSSLTVNGSLATSSIADNGRWGVYNSGALTLVSTTVKNNRYGGVYSNGNSQLTGNEISYNGQSNSSYGYGVQFYNALPNGNQSMSRNLVHHNYVGGLRLDARVGGITDLVEHNTFDNNDLYSSTSYELYAYVTTGTVTVRDNILTNNDYYGVYRSGSSGTFDIHHNDAYGNGTNNFYNCDNGGPGSFTCNPLYVAADGTNYRLTSNSPARMADSGTPPRDMGALMHLADPTPTLTGVLRQNTTLTAAGSPWVMPGDLVVPAGVTLTIEPGALVQPANSSDFMGCGQDDGLAELIVQGSLVVNATPANRAVIRPTTATMGRWHGVRFEPSSTVNSVSGLEVGYGATCVDVENPNLTLTNTLVHHCLNRGVDVASGSALTMTGDLGKHGGNFLLESAVTDVGTTSAYAIYSLGDLTLSNTEVARAYDTNVYSYGRATLTGNRIHGSRYGYGIDLRSPAGEASVVQRNLVFDNYDGGIYAYEYGTGGTILIDHNTVHANDNGGTTYGLYLRNQNTDPNGIVVRNNIVSSNGEYGVYRYSSGYSIATADYNDVWNHSSYNYYNVSEGSNTISTNPLYNYLTGDDFRLQPPSPARGADDAGGDLGALPFFVIPVDHIVVTPATPDVKAAATRAFTAQAREGWSDFPINGLDYSWAVVNGGGTINAGGGFTAGCTLGSYADTVQATTAGVPGATGVTIVPGDAASVSITPATATVDINQSAAFGATALDSCGNVTPESVTWSVTDPSAGVVDSNGVFTANVYSGTYVDLIKATTTATGAVGFATVSINPDPVAAIVISPNPGNINTSTSGQFTATGFDMWSNEFPINPVWSLNGCALGALDPATGVFTAGAATGTCASGIVATDGAVSGYATVNVTNAPLASITVTPNPGSVEVGETVQFSATGIDTNGNAVAISPTWTVSGGGAIDSNGRYTAACTLGTFTVTATQGSISGDAAVQVGEGAVASIVVNPSTATVAVNGTQGFTAEGRDACGNAIAITPLWAVVAGGGAINAGSGLFTAGSVIGTYASTVRASAGGVDAFASVNVTAGPLQTVVVTPNPASVAINASVQFAAAGEDQYGNPIAISPTWSVTNGGGTVNGAGLFTAGGTAGTFNNTVRATASGVSGSASVVVNPGPLAAITLSPLDPTLAINAAQQFTATGRDAGGNAVAISPTWSVVNGGGSIDATGRFLAGGVAGLFANTVRAADGAVSATTSVTVEPGPLATMTVSPATASVAAGGTQQYAATGKDAGGNTVPVTPTWSLVSCTLGTLSSSGLFTAGTTSGNCPGGIRAASGSISATASVDVVPGPLATLEVSPSDAMLNPAGTQSFTATGRDSHGNNVPATVAWSVAAAAAGTINGAGLFTAGTTAGTWAGAVVATSGSITGSASVTVNPGALATVTVSPNPAAVPALGTRQFSAAGADTYGNAVSISPTWSVVAGGGSINASGLFTAGPTPGTFAGTVRATAGGVSGTATVEVTAGAVAAITISPNPATLTIGGTRQLTATGTDTAGNPVSITPTWSVLNGGGTVNASGLFTAGSTAGTFAGTVQASADGVSATATVVVEPGPLAAIVLAPENPAVAAGGQQQFTAQGEDSGGNAVAFTPTWSVVNGGGSISAAGLFTASTTAGTYANTVRVADAGSGIAALTSVTVGAGPLVGLSIAPTAATLPVDAAQQFTATGRDTYGNEVQITPAWSMNACLLGSIDAAGLFTAGTGAGSCPAGIRATSGGLTAEAGITVEAGPLAQIAVTPASPSVTVGATQAFAASGADQYGNPVALTPAWRVIDAAAGSIDAAGVFTAGLVAGSYADAVEASQGAVAGTASVSVVSGALASLAISPASATLTPNATRQFAATGEDQYGNPVAFTPSWAVVNGGGSIGASGLFTAGTGTGLFANTVQASSGSVTATASVEIVAGALARIVLTPSPATVTAAGTVQFTALGEDAVGNPVGLAPAWSVANGGGSIDQSGLFTAGTTANTFTNTVRVTQDGVTASATVNVTAGPLAAVVVSPAAITLGPGGTQQFAATGRDAWNNSVATLPVWSLANPAAGSIDAGGLFTAGGTAGAFPGAILATDGAVSGTASVTIEAGALAQLVIDPASATLAPAATRQFSATGLDASGNTVPVSVTWSVVNGGGSINSTGLFTAAGTAGTYANTVRATNGSLTAFASITVATGGLATITLSPADSALAAGATLQLTAEGRDVWGNLVAITPVWSTSNGGSIDQNGLFTAGCATGAFPNSILATVGSVTGQASVTVNAGALVGLALSPAATTLATGGTQQFTATGHDACGNALPVNPTWSVTQAQAGTVDASGLFTGSITPGSYPGAVRAEQGSFSASADVSLVAGSIARVVVSPASSVLAPLAGAAFSAQAFDFEGNPVATGFSWSVAAGGGSIDAAGLFTAGTLAGTFPNTVRAAADNGITGFASVTVTAGPLVAIDVTPPTAQAPVLGTVTFVASPKDAWGNRVATPITWSVVAAGGAINQSGVFTAGTTAGSFANTVRAASGTVAGLASVQVNPGPVTTVALSPASAEVAVLGQQAFTAQASDAYGNAVLTPVTWTLVGGGGSLNAGGLFTAGTVAGIYPDTVRATMSGVSSHATVSVVAGALSQLTVAPASATLRTRATQQFTATGLDAYGNAVSVNPGWSVELADAGTVSATGLFRAGTRAGNYPSAVVASVGQVTGFADIVVTAGPLATVAVTPAAVSLEPGAAQQFEAAGLDTDGNPVPITAVWTLAAPSAGTLDAGGRFVAGYALGAYANAVRATVDTVVGSASVTVIAPPIDRVAIGPENPTVALDSETAFSAAAFDARGQEISGLQVTWQLVNGGGTLSSGGVFRAGAEPGTFTNTVQATIAGKSAVTTVTVSSDFDADGMPDTWELAQGLDPTDATDAHGDLDADNLDNLAEFDAGTDPRDADSDEDGVLDGNEVKPGVDSDGDGLVNALDPDSDDDGLFDGLEMAVTSAPAATDVSQGKFLADQDPSTSTDPTNADTDGDTIPDGLEDLNQNGLVDEGETDPNVADKPCTGDEECGDGSCVGGLCQPGEPPVVPCAPGCGDGEYCNAETNACEPVTVDQTGCGCGSGAGSAPLAGLMILALVAVRRRRRPAL